MKRFRELISLMIMLTLLITVVPLKSNLIIPAAYAIDGNTFCNPLNLDYRFCTSEPSRREAADPMVVLFDDNYYIFASMSGGYWWSSDFHNWTLVIPTGLEVEKYAPSVWVIGSTMYYTSSESGNIYKTTDPKSGVWSQVCKNPHSWNDPWVFVDTDGKVYCYHNSSQNGTIDCVQLDPNNNFAVIGDEVVCMYSNPTNNGFEVNGNNNESGLPWTEAAEMIKIKGKYYLLYSTPGTEKPSYCDAYYVAESPMGPFTFGANNPVTRKSAGYVTGTGHNGIFFDKAGKLWTITSVRVYIKDWWERRLGVFPVDVDTNGYLHANTAFGDYPQYYPGVAQDPVSNNSPGWNLLSRGKTVTAFSAYDTFTVAKAVDENIRTYWSASSGNAGEWLQVDLGKNCTINAVQSNFYESKTTYTSGRTTSFSWKYKVEYSTDSTTWTMMIDKSTSTKDSPHDYVQLTTPVTARYLKITNMGEVPGYGYFALSDFRIFGNGGGSAPSAVRSVKTTRLTDQRCADVSWSVAAGVEGYILRYGIAPDKLWNHFQILSGTSCQIRCLVTGQDYYYKVDAYNENGVTKADSNTLSPRSAFTKIEAEEYDDQSGIKTQSCDEGGYNIGYIENGDYAVYNNIDFGSGANSFNVRTSSLNDGGVVEIRYDSITGALAGTCQVLKTGGWQTWATSTCSVNGVTGKHDLYLKFTGGTGYLFNINWFQFSSGIDRVKQNVMIFKKGVFRTAISKGKIVVIPRNNSPYNVSVFRSDGRLVTTRENVVGKMTVPVRSRGSYVVSIKSEEVIENKKIIVN